MIKECHCCDKETDRYAYILDYPVCKRCKMLLSENLDKSEPEIIEAVQTLRKQNHENKNN